ncbi:MAG: CRISPR system precrRNA processing endoribonuclease RAMP protein Cas6 [bacterium]
MISDLNSTLLGVHIPPGISIPGNPSYCLYSWLLKKVKENDPALSEEIHSNHTPLISISNIKRPEQGVGIFRLCINSKNLMDILHRIIENTQYIKLQNRKFEKLFFDYGSHDISLVNSSEHIQKLLDYGYHKEDTENIKMNFLSPTFFRKKRANYIFPDPEFVFYDLASKFYSNTRVDTDIEKIKNKASHIKVNKMELCTGANIFRGISQIGFKGQVNYSLKSIRKEDRQIFITLARFAFYSGTGVKTKFGFGETFPEF